MKRTLMTLGNSTAVTLPRDQLERLGLKAGDTVEVEASDGGIFIRPDRTLDPEFEAAFRRVFSRYRETFRRLAEYDRSEGEGKA